MADETGSVIPERSEESQSAPQARKKDQLSVEYLRFVTVLLYGAFESRI
jgi:hypothetical protein